MLGIHLTTWPSLYHKPETDKEAALEDKTDKEHKTTSN